MGLAPTWLTVGYGLRPLCKMAPQSRLFASIGDCLPDGTLGNVKESGE